jgi:arylformamidase
MSHWIYLSHFLNTSTPAYGGRETFQSVVVRSMECKDSCNAARWTLPNHIGIHIDCPCHFSLNGKTLSDYTAHFWVFQSVCLLGISPIDLKQQINLATLPVESIPSDVDLLIIKTGFGKMRQDPKYWNDNPAFSPDLADGLRKHCPNLRLMGFDSISLSSWINRDLGRQAHTAFLDSPQPILLLEDMDLSQIESNTSFLQVIVRPLLVEHADAAPCTVLAGVDV